LTLIVYAAAAGRVTRLINSDIITDPIRVAAARRGLDNESSPRERHRWLMLHELLECPWCVSMWVTFGFTWVPLYFADNPVAQYVCVALAASYVIGAASPLLERDDTAMEVVKDD
jgi:hypothetical protein